MIQCCHLLAGCRPRACSSLRSAVAGKSPEEQHCGLHSAQTAQENCISSSWVLTSASQKLPAERNQEISQAGSAVRAVCASGTASEEQARKKEGSVNYHVNTTTTGWGRTGQHEGCSCRTAEGRQTEALKHGHRLGIHSPLRCLLPWLQACLPLPQLPCFCTWRMGSGIRYLQQDLTRRTAVSRHTL